MRLTIEEQVASLKLSKRLRELKVPQESAFYWVERHQYPFEMQMHDLKQEPSSDESLWKSYSAFTVAELGKMLPVKKYDDGMWKQIREWEEEGFTEANARARMLVYLRGGG